MNECCYRSGMCYTQSDSVVSTVVSAIARGCTTSAEVFGGGSERSGSLCTIVLYYVERWIVCHIPS